MDTKTVITKETKNRIRVDFEGKLTFTERLKKKLTTSNTWKKVLLNIFRFILMLGVSYVILYPFFARIAGSFMTKEDVIDPTVSLIPKHFTLEIYHYLIVENHYFQALLNTTLLSLLCALIQTFIACLIGYGLAKFKFKGNKAVMLAVVLTMIIPHRTLKLSMLQHFVFFDIGKVLSWDYPGIFELITGSPLHLENTYWPLAILSLCGLAFKNGLYIYMMRQFFKGVPDELEESAYVDGSGVFRTFFQIILPLSIPMMITIFLFAFSWQWTDEFYTTLFFIDDRNKIYLMPDVYMTPPPSLETNYGGQSLYYSVISNTAGIMIIAPLVIVYLFCQRYLVQGIERSGLVG
mgnify:FL=1